MPDFTLTRHRNRQAFRFYTLPFLNLLLVFRHTTAQVPDFTMTLTPEMAEPFLASGALNGAFDPRVILVTNKDEAPGVFKALAMNMRHASKYQFGWLRHDDASRPVFREMKVRPGGFDCVRIPAGNGWHVLQRCFRCPAAGVNLGLAFAVAMI